MQGFKSNGSPDKHLLLNRMATVQRQFFTLAAHQKPSVGDTKMSALGIDHLGWLICDGRLLNISDFTFLFNVLGYAFGGSGSQFRLPDPSGRVPGAIGSGTGLTARALGDSVGEEEHTLTIAEMPSHNHGGTTGSTSLDLTQTSLVTGINTTTERSTASAGLSSTYVTGVTATTVDPSITPNPHNHTIASQGGDQPHNNMQPTLFMGNMFIYSGKTNYGNYPYTKGYYGYPAVNSRPQNIL